MPHPKNDDDLLWEQLSMLPAKAYTLTLTVGLMPADDHAQFQLEVRDGTSGELLALSSRPHVGIEDAHNELSRFQRRLDTATANLTHPFPP